MAVLDWVEGLGLLSLDGLACVLFVVVGWEVCVFREYGGFLEEDGWNGDLEEEGWNWGFLGSCFSIRMARQITSSKVHYCCS